MLFNTLMKKYFRYFITCFLFILCVLASWYYFYCKYIFGWNTDQFNFSRMITASCFSLFFFGLLFSIEYSHYKQLFKFILTYGLLVYALVYSLQFFYYISLFVPSYFWNFTDMLMMISFSILAQGIILYIIHYIKNSTAKLENRKLFGKYHIHEGFVGITLLIMSVVFWIIRSILVVYQTFMKELGLILSVTQVVLFLFIYLGSFFFFRDFDDIMRLKFLEVKESDQIRGESNTNNTPVFSKIGEEDVHFFKFPQLIYYPFGILLTSFAINAIVFGNGYLPQFIFHLNYESVIILGYILSFISGGLIGKDWFRIFKRFYPDLYCEIESVIKNLRK